MLRYKTRGDAADRAAAFLRWLLNDARRLTDAQMSQAYSDWLSQELDQCKREDPELCDECAEPLPTEAAKGAICADCQTRMALTGEKPWRERQSTKAAASYYRTLGRQRFFVSSTMGEWHVRERHEWIGIPGGSGLMGIYHDPSSAKKEADRLNALDAECLR